MEPQVTEGGFAKEGPKSLKNPEERGRSRTSKGERGGKRKAKKKIKS